MKNLRLFWKTTELVLQMWLKYSKEVEPAIYPERYKITLVTFHETLEPQFIIPTLEYSEVTHMSATDMEVSSMLA